MTFITTSRALLVSSSLAKKRDVRVGKTLLFGTASIVCTVEQLHCVKDWQDRIAFQRTWTLQQKGWNVAVEWKMMEFGVGLFAKQDIPKDAVLREGKTGVNVVQFKNAQEMESFCTNDDSQRLKPEIVSYV